jgi:hypothetical protein
MDVSWSVSIQLSVAGAVVPEAKLPLFQRKDWVASNGCNPELLGEIESVTVSPVLRESDGTPA